MKKNKSKQFLSKSFLVLMLLLISLGALADKRVALIIGNSHYKSITSLPNATTNSKLIKKTLESINFKTIYLENASLSTIQIKINEFVQKARSSDISLIYYAGHAVQHKGDNYIVPVDVKNLSNSSIVSDAMTVNRVARSMKNLGSSSKVIILDTCRPGSFKKVYQSFNQGLLPMNSPINGMLIAYSTSPGNLSTDGVCRNNPYAFLLSRHLAQEGSSIMNALQGAAEDVVRETQGRQSPWLSSRTTRNLSLNTKENDSSSLSMPQISNKLPLTPRPVSKVLSAADYFKKAQIHRIRDEFDDALVAYKNIIDRYPQSPQAIDSEQAMAEIYKSTGRWDDALAVYTDIANYAQKSSVKKKAIKSIAEIYDHYCSQNESQKAKSTYGLLCELSMFTCTSLAMKSVKCDAGFLIEDMKSTVEGMKSHTNKIKNSTSTIFNSINLEPKEDSNSSKSGK